MKRTEVLKRLIENSGLNIKAFSERAGLPYSTMRSMLERGIGNTSVDNVIKVCKTLDITVEQLEKMAESENLKEWDKQSNQLKEEVTLYETGQFKTPEAAMKFILNQKSIMGFGGFNVNKMSDEEVIEFANELLNQLKLISYKYKK